MPSVRPRTFVVGLVTVFAFGCGGGSDAGRVSVYKTTGKVTVAGKPVADAVVTFSSTEAEPTPTALGRTDAQGNYSLKTYEADDGAAPGDYMVLVQKETPGEALTPEQAHEAAKAAEGTNPAAAHRQAEKNAPKGEVPARYGRMGESDLTATVKADGENKFDFDLRP